MNSLFNPETFLTQSVTGALDTKYPVIPGGEYPAIVSKIEAREMPNDKDPAHPYTVLDLTWDIDDQSVREATKNDTPSCRQSVFLDLKEGQLDMSPAKNVQLGRLREALGMNDPDKPFTFTDLVGQPAIVKVEHTPNAKDPESPYSNVTKIAKM